jgi:hypothetical protein
MSIGEKGVYITRPLCIASITFWHAEELRKDLLSEMIANSNAVDFVPDPFLSPIAQEKD